MVQRGDAEETRRKDCEGCLDGISHWSLGDAGRVWRKGAEYDGVGSGASAGSQSAGGNGGWGADEAAHGRRGPVGGRDGADEAGGAGGGGRDADGADQL